jgi:hypothetical protein
MVLSYLQAPAPSALWAAAPPASFCVALRPQPINATASLQPIIDFGLAFKALDVA